MDSEFEHNFPKTITATIFPGHLRYASTHLDLVLPVHKHNSLLAELRSAALATIHERYQDQDWLHEFTDKSATASFIRAGAGAFSNSFNLKEPLSAWSDNFDGDIYAIVLSFRAISTTPGLNIVIFIDSQAVIKTVSGYYLFPSKLEFECKQLINSFLCTGREVVLQWIPSHCGIHGNEQAGQRGFDAASILPSDASSKRQATSQGQSATEENFYTYRPGCWRILVLSARWPKTCSAFCPT
ncbi:uncharacterized protein LOC103524116 [Trichonephila clavipes]|uniref:Uncharacterized protein LOC103524116 n=1 Tax=Trichonephila clavipes TaxID=2585209 RepID=A0A8X6W2G2_TRICX|nr:uncharacterized protein LOC103524116 [Trichonephila clavipes]